MRRKATIKVTVTETDDYTDFEFKVRRRQGWAIPAFLRNMEGMFAGTIDGEVLSIDGKKPA